MSVQVVNNGGGGWDPFGTLATIAGMATGQPWIGIAYNGAKNLAKGNIGGAIGGLVTGLANNKTKNAATNNTNSQMTWNDAWGQPTDYTKPGVFSNFLSNQNRI